MVVRVRAGVLHPEKTEITVFVRAAEDITHLLRRETEEVGILHPRREAEGTAGMSRLRTEAEDGMTRRPRRRSAAEDAARHLRQL